MESSNSKIIIRPIHAADTAKFKAFWAGVLSENIPANVELLDPITFPTKMQELMIQNKAICLIGLDEKMNIIGFCNLTINKEKSWMVGIFVIKSHRGKDTASELLRELEAAAIKQRIHELLASVRKTNFRSIAFFKKNGFQIKQSNYSLILCKAVMPA